MQNSQTGEAIMLLRAALSTFKEIGDARGVAGVSLLQARLYLRQGRMAQALQAGLETLKTAYSSGLLRLSILRRFKAWWVLLTLA